MALALVKSDVTADVDLRVGQASAQVIELAIADSQASSAETNTQPKGDAG